MTLCPSIWPGWLVEESPLKAKVSLEGGSRGPFRLESPRCPRALPEDTPLTLPVKIFHSGLWKLGMSLWGRGLPEHWRPAEWEEKDIRIGSPKQVTLYLPTPLSLP